MDCAQITKNIIAAECNKKAASGLETRVILLNYSDVDKPKCTLTGDVISGIVMKASKKGFSFTSFDKSYNDAGASVNVGTYMNTVTHTLPLRLFSKSTDAKDFVNEFIAGARIIAIVQNKETGANGEIKYEAYGWENGLTIKEMQSTVQMADGVVYPLTLASEDNAQEGSLPKSVFSTDEATTDTMIDSLITTAPAS